MLRIFCSDLLGHLPRKMGVLCVALFLSQICVAAQDKKSTEPQVASWTAKIIRDPQSRIEGLSISEVQIPVTLMPTEEVMRPLVEIEGHYYKRGWNLIAQGESLLGSFPDKTLFRIYFYLNGKNNKITLTAQGPNGEVTTEEITVLAPQAQEFRISARWGEALFSLGAGILNFHQTEFGSFNSKTGVVSVTYSTPPWKTRLGAIAEVRSTLLTFQSSPINSGPQLITGRIDGTYTFAPTTKNRFENSVALGMTYLTLLSNGSPFGFSNLLAPELGFRSYYPLNYYSGFFADIKYAPLGAFTGIQEYALDVSLGWSRRLPNYHRFEIKLNYSDLAYQPETDLKIQTQLFSLRFGYTI